MNMEQLLSITYMYNSEKIKGKLYSGGILLPKHVYTYPWL